MIKTQVAEGWTLNEHESGNEYSWAPFLDHGDYVVVEIDKDEDLVIEGCDGQRYIPIVAVRALIAAWDRWKS